MVDFVVHSYNWFMVLETRNQVGLVLMFPVVILLIIEIFRDIGDFF